MSDGHGCVLYEENYSNFDPIATKLSTHHVWHNFKIEQERPFILLMTS